ncbi:MAG: hypothetical protein M5U01_11720 [Ardenticatenaceae bacterium]|nr:hypothetical protein [Ardenticatenaceae bacterium]
MNPLTPLTGLSNTPREPIACTQVWSALTPHYRDNVQHVMLLVCCHLADGSEARTPPAPSNTEGVHERA